MVLTLRCIRGIGRMNAASSHLLGRCLNVCRTASSSYINRRSLVSDQFLRLNGFRNRSNRITTRFGDKLGSFKSAVEGRVLEKQDIQDFDADCYLHVVDADKLKLLPSLLQCVTYEESEAHSFTHYPDTMFGLALKRCSLANDLAAAQTVYKLMGKEHMNLVNTLLLMDLMYENGQHSQCLDIAIKSHESIGPIFVDWFYTLSIVSAFHLNTPEALDAVLKFFNAKCDMDVQRHGNSPTPDLEVGPDQSNDPDQSAGPAQYFPSSVMKRLRNVLALLCLKQGRINQCLFLLKNSRREYLVPINIRAMAYLKAGNVPLALNELHHLRRHLESKHGADSYFMFYDVFIELRDRIKENDISKEFAFIKYFGSPQNFNKFVHRSPLEIYTLSGVIKSPSQSQPVSTPEADDVTDKQETGQLNAADIDSV